MTSTHSILSSNVNKLLAIPGMKFMHASLFFSVFAEWQIQNYPEWIITNRRRLMALSCIKSPISYHRSIKMLVKNNLIEYKPSYHPQEGSKIKIVVVPELEMNSLLLPNKEPNPQFP